MIPKTLEFSHQQEYPLSRRTPMRATVNDKSKSTAPAPKVRKSKFQADLAPSEDSIVRALKAELQMTSNTDFLSDALALFRWAVSERKRGNRIVSESATGERKILVFPHLERAAPELALPRIDVHWSQAELENLAQLASKPRAEPADALIRAMSH